MWWSFEQAKGGRWDQSNTLAINRKIWFTRITHKHQFLDMQNDHSLPSKLNRRTFLGLLSAGLASSAMARSYNSDASPVRYPDPHVVVLDPRFAKYKLGTTHIQRPYHSDDMLWAEGPAWNGVGRYLVWSDIPNNVQLRWLEENGQVSTFRHPSGNSNGNTFDYQGRQISCEHGTRRVVRYEYDGSVTVLADSYGVGGGGGREARTIKLRLWPRYDSEHRFVDRGGNSIDWYCLRYLVPALIARPLTRLGLDCSISLPAASPVARLLTSRSGLWYIFMLILIAALLLVGVVAICVSCPIGTRPASR